MSQLFDRFFQWIRSEFEPGGPGSGRSAGPGAPEGDADYRQAEEELNEFLNRGRGAGGPSAGDQTRPRSGTGPTAGLPLEIAEAYRFLGLEPGADWPTVQKTQKDLLRRHHPDRHMGHAANQAKATETSQRINEAYYKIRRFLNV